MRCYGIDYTLKPERVTYTERHVLHLLCGSLRPAHTVVSGVGHSVLLDVCHGSLLVLCHSEGVGHSTLNLGFLGSAVPECGICV